MLSVSCMLKHSHVGVELASDIGWEVIVYHVAYVDRVQVMSRTVENEHIESIAIRLSRE